MPLTIDPVGVEESQLPLDLQPTTVTQPFVPYFSAELVDTMTPQILSSNHLYSFLDMKRYEEQIELAVRALQGWDDEFDTIAFRGMSGALIGPPVALEMGKQLILVRKPEDTTHSPYSVEGHRTAKNYIIIDDFTSSGDTQREIRRKVATFAPQAKCLGVLEVNYISHSRIKEDTEFYGKYRLVYTSCEGKYR